MIGSDLEAKSYSATNNLIQMKNAGHSSRINIIVQTGGGGGKIDGKRFIDFSKVQRHEILNGTIHTLMDLGQRNMGASDTLSDFIEWGALKFPAKKYVLILWDHGSGLNGFGKDLIFNNDILSPLELREALLAAEINTHIKFELIGFDACLMSSLEIASRLENITHYVVSSEEVEPLWGWNYTTIIQNLSANSHEPAGSLGMSIVDSYVKLSKYLSTSEKFGADKQITLAVIDITKIPQLKQELNALSDPLYSDIHDLPSAINLSKSVDLTEHYGQSVRGSTGFVDLSDLLLNIKEKYPSLSERIKAVQNTLGKTIIYRYNGEVRPNANGLSVYMPLKKNEYNNKTELFVISPSWFRLLLLQKSMLAGDIEPPVISSIREANIVKASIFGSIESIYAEMVTNSSKGHNLIYLQTIDPSLIDNHGYFQYKQHKMLVVCNETKCIPVSMKLEINRDNQFAFIPVRLDSNQSNIHEDVSLVYEIGKDDKFVFLGANPEIDPEKTIPKGEYSLKKNDSIFFKAIPWKATFTSTQELTGQELSTSTYAEDGPLIVNHPENIQPRYINLTSPFAIRFVMCDYSDKCDETRWYSFNHNVQKLPVLIDDLEFGYDVLSNNTPTLSRSNSVFYTYVNPTFGFKLQYPSDWVEQRQNIYDINHLLDDPTVVQFFPPKPFSSGAPSGLPTSLQITVTDWPFKQSPGAFFDFFNKTYNQKNVLANNVKIIYSNATLVAGNPAFKFIFRYISIPEQSLGVAKQQRMEQIISILMNNRMYIIDFASYSSEFYHYLPITDKIVNSFGSYMNQISNATASNYNYGNRFSNSSINKEGTFTHNNTEAGKEELNLLSSLSSTINNNFSTYTDPIYRYSIKYPFFSGAPPLNMKDFDHPNLRGELFTLNSSPLSRVHDLSDPGTW